MRVFKYNFSDIKILNLSIKILKKELELKERADEFSIQEKEQENWNLPLRYRLTHLPHHCGHIQYCSDTTDVLLLQKH